MRARYNGEWYRRYNPHTPRTPPGYDRHAEKKDNTCCIVSIIVSVLVVAVGAFLLIFFWNDITGSGSEGGSSDGSTDRTSGSSSGDSFIFQFREDSGHWKSYDKTSQRTLAVKFKEHQTNPSSSTVVKLRIGADLEVEVEFGTNNSITQHSLSYDKDNKSHGGRNGKTRRVQRIKGSLPTQKATKSKTPSKPIKAQPKAIVYHGKPWEWNNDGTWKKYTPEASNTLEKQLKLGKKTFRMEAQTGQLNPSGDGIIVDMDLTKMEQRGEEKTRKVRRGGS